jgi:hypothetical protein
MTMVERYLRAVRDHLPRAIVRVSIAATIVLTAVNAAFEGRRLVRMQRAERRATAA